MLFLPSFPPLLFCGLGDGNNDDGDVYDQRHSWFKNKILSYSVTLHVPSLLATERAKCSRASNALRNCVKERDDAVKRGDELSADVKGIDASVEVRCFVIPFILEVGLL